MIVFPDQVTGAEPVGGKAASLTRLAQEGFAPPAFFVILPDAFEDGTPVEGFAAALDAALTRLGSGPYAVRSSGVAEDGAEHSHAGQFDTVLNVAAEDVTEAAAKVWRSGFSERMETYTALRGGEATPPAIVVQRMIAAQVSGVAFSADPVSGLRGRCVISAIEGLGEALVSGEADGQNWLVEGDTVLETPDAPILTETQVHEVAALAARAEAAFGAPQDIEWAIDDGGLHILQA
ncbi:MAG: PEP/pyruvate-binding domain-containing protein, partial [Pseudomonadota bacterium]